MKLPWLFIIFLGLAPFLHSQDSSPLDLLIEPEPFLYDGKRLVLGDDTFRVSLKEPQADRSYAWSLRGPDGIVRGTFKDGLILEGQKGSSVPYTLIVAARSESDSSQAMQEYQIEVVHDREPPPMPVLEGLGDKKSVREPLQLEFKGNGTIEYLLSKAPFSSSEGSWQTYQGPLVLTPVDGEEIEYRLVYRARDEAGNLSPTSATISVLLDRKVPEVPRFRIVRPNAADLHPVEGGLNSLPGKSTLFIDASDSTVEATVDGTRLDAYVPVSGIVLDKAHGSETVIKITLTDQAGNTRTLGDMRFLFDRVAPELPPSPQIQRAFNKGTIAWEPFPETIEFRWTEEDPFQAFTGTLFFSLSGPGDKKTLQYRSIDPAGNTSAIQSLDIGFMEVLSPPVLADGMSGRPLSLPALIRFNSTGEDVVIRYELDTAPREVSLSSPRYAQGIQVMNDGTEKKLVLSWKAWKEGFEPSETQAAVIWVDGQIPLRPQLIVPEFSIRNRELVIQVQPPVNGEKILYHSRFVSAGRDELPGLRERVVNRPEKDQFSELNVPRLDYRLGTDTIGLLVMWLKTVDPAGNESETVEYREALHPGLVFVDSTQSVRQVSGNGSLFKPFTDLKAALHTKAPMVILGAGSHPLESVELDSITQLDGGFDFSTWATVPLNQDDSATVVFPKRSATSPLFSVASANLTINNLFLVDSGLTVPALIQGNKATVTILKAHVSQSRGNGAIILKEGGLVVQESIVQAREAFSGNLIMLDGSRFSMKGSTVEQAALPPSLVRQSKGADYRLISIRNGQDSRIDASLIWARYGDETQALEIETSAVFMIDTSIHGGEGESSAIALRAKNSTLSLRECRLRSSSAAGTSALAQLTASAVFSERSVWQLQGAKGALGIVAQNSTVELIDDSMIGQGASGYANYLSLNDCRASLSGIKADWTSAGEDALFARILGSDLKVVDSVFNLRGTRNMVAFSVLEAASLTMAGTTIQTVGGRACFLVGKAMDGLNVRDSTISGWKRLGELTGAAQGNNVDLVEEDFASLGHEGSVFSNNQIQMGL